MIGHVCCSCWRAGRIVFLAAAVEIVTFPLVHALWEYTPLHSVSTALGMG